MGRKKKKVERQTITVVVNGKAVLVIMHPPVPPRTSWYAFWHGLSTSRSTGQSDYEQAVLVVQDMLGNGGKRGHLADAILSNEEFEEIQRRHYQKKQKPDAKERGEKSLESCLDAIAAFKAITGIESIALATPEDCERFQHDALALPKNWRSKYPNSRQDVGNLSANTIDKWSRALQAAFERANANALGRKCIRSVVEERKLLKSNPWHKISWIEGFDREIRQFDPMELISLLDYFDTKWAGVTMATALAKTYLWSWGRRIEIARLRWDEARIVGNEVQGYERHFEIVGKWGVDKWFRIPEPLYQEFVTLKTDSPYVFAAYNRQLREFHQKTRHPWRTNRLKPDYHPEDCGDWFYNRVNDWSKSLPNGAACVHVFRKTSLQYARSGEDLNRQVAADARVGAGVMMTNYVKETDPEMRHRSNRMFARIAAALPTAVALRYGYEPTQIDPLIQRLTEAIVAQNWALANAITADLAKRTDRYAG